MRGFPAHKNVVGRLAFQNGFELGFEGFGARQAQGGIAITRIHGAALLGDPIAQVGLGQRLQLGARERMDVQQRRKTFLVPIPHMPDKRPFLETRHVLGKEFVTQP